MVYFFIIFDRSRDTSWEPGSINIR